MRDRRVCISVCWCIKCAMVHLYSMSSAKRGGGRKEGGGKRGRGEVREKRREKRRGNYRSGRISILKLFIVYLTASP